MKKLFFTSLILVSAVALSASLLGWQVVEGQNVAITDDNGYTANPSAMLDVKSITKGMLVPRLSTAQRTAISSPAAGLLVFDTTAGDFYFYNGSSWVNLTSGISSDLWGQTGNRVFLNDTTYNLGIGTKIPAGKMEVKADGDIGDETVIFGVVNYNGDTVFAVYPGGVRVLVEDDQTKASGNRSGFAVGGFSLSKNPTNEYLRITPDSVRIYVEEGTSSKSGANKGGFAVGGFSLSKGTLTNEYLRVTDDSVRIYIDKNGGAKSSGATGGFAVGGFSLSKSTPDDYFNISGADSAEIISPAEARIVWYPTKEALLAGKVLIESVDSVGQNSTATGNQSKAIGDYSQAFGFKARAFGENSTAIGYYPNAIGKNSFALGDSVIATGLSSYAMGAAPRDAGGLPIGAPTKATGNYSIALGLSCLSSQVGAFAAGSGNSATGAYATALGYYTTASAENATALGKNAVASGQSSIAFGDGANASEYKAIALGWNTEATGNQAVAIGASAECPGYFSTAIGYLCNADGEYTAAIGGGCHASGVWGGFSAGMSANASGGYGATAIGFSPEASGQSSIALGYSAEATGAYAVAIGNDIEAQGDYTFGIALSDQTGTVITESNTMAIMGGDVGIGTVSPDADLHVVGSATYGSVMISPSETASGDDSELIFTEDRDGTYNISIKYEGSDNTMEWWAKNDADTWGPLMELTYNLSFGIPYLNTGFIRPMTDNIFDLGSSSLRWDDIFATNGTIQTSDRRLKQDINEIEYGLSTVMNLKPVTFRWKSKPQDGRKLGLIAQEVIEVIPEVVDIGDDERQTLGLNYAELTPVLIKAIQEQQSEIEELKRTIEIYKKDFDDLKAIVQASAKE
ncbi:MAG: tail fiber domain-containing protein [Bacteroidetes bacterium]|nr:tail fiber domain-containing protein [Bacteroidota bacterium]